MNKLLHRNALLNESFSVNSVEIYWLESVYGDDVVPNYIVEFDAPQEKLDKQFKDFQELLKEQGRRTNLRKIRQQFSEFAEIFGK